ncbi:MAG: DUF3016 domain-containing protein [Thauera sp.]|nr:DUF3016 domain-containing protein [Thauera sp.]
MNTRILLAAVVTISFLTAAASTAEAEVTVRFVDAERHADVGTSEAERNRNMAMLDRHLRSAAAQCVAEDERLTVAVLDVDLAGDIDWSRSSAVELRVLREVSWPRIELEYALIDAGGQTVVQGREQVSDMNYLAHSARARFARETLPYERLMLENWAASRLCRPPR